MRKLSIIGILMAVLMISCGKANKSIGTQDSTEKLGTLISEDSSMLEFEKLDDYMMAVMLDMGIYGNYKKYGIDSFKPMEALKDVSISKDCVLMKRDIPYSKIDTKERACDQVNRFIYSDKGWKEIKANNGIFSHYKCRCDGREYDTIVNHVLIHFVR